MNERKPISGAGSAHPGAHGAADSGHIRVVDQGDVFRKELDQARAAGLSIGLVPTMGALHRGHVSLIARSARECNLTAVTVFVNPLQFGSATDLAAYPRDLEADVAVATEAGADLVFAPSAAEMWPDGSPLTSVAVSGVASGLEGVSRPGHFDGVATVVARLFNLAGPCRAYFGEKDFQQLTVVRRLVDDLAFPIEVVGCPTVREPDGLALSSRNVRLSAPARVAATVLYRALRAAQVAYRSGEHDASTLRHAMAATIFDEPLVRLDYAEVADPITLVPVVGDASSDARLLVAAEVGGTRLIDNVAVVSDDERTGS